MTIIFKMGRLGVELVTSHAYNIYKGVRKGT